MTAVLDAEAPFREIDDAAETPAPPSPPADGSTDEPVSVPVRPLLVAALSSSAAAIMTGGIFGSFFARGVGIVAALLGVGWFWLTSRSRRRSLMQGVLPLVALGIGTLSLAGASGGPANLPHLVDVAIKSANLLRPPVPFDPGWRPILIMLFMLVGYAAASVGETSPQLGLLLPAPLFALTAITQPKAGQFISALAAVIPFIGAVTVLFGGDLKSSGQLSNQFELRRAIRAVITFIPIIAILVVLNSTSILFPKPVYDPSQKPQKPKAVPLSAVVDHILFQVDGPITGPWKLGSLDVYDGRSWKLPPFDPKKLQRIGGNGVLDKQRPGTVTVTFTTGDLGTSATLPGVVDPVSINLVSPAGQKVVFDNRSGTFRVPSGRVPVGLVYKMSLPKYPSASDLRNAAALTAALPHDVSAITSPPPAVQSLLAQAPSDPWDRMDFLLKKLAAVEIAVGAGSPVDVPPSTVQRLLAGNHEGSPYELVAAQAMLARWAGVPSRIGFGFDGDQKEGNVFTVRPKNAAQWLEVYFQGAGWIPIITAPPRAKESLNNDKNQKFNPTIQAGSDVAVELYIPVKVKNLQLLYQRVRTIIFGLLPFGLLILAAYALTPWGKKTWRRSKRRRWAADTGPDAQVAVEYAEFRDLATDLGLGNPYDTPLEFLDAVVEDTEHEELAWLVSKSLYGSLRGRVGDEDVAAARELVASLNRRLSRAQPFQTRALALLTRTSLNEPYSTEIPNVATLHLPKVTLRRAARKAKIVNA